MMKVMTNSREEREVQSDEFKSDYCTLEASIVCNLSATIRLCDIQCKGTTLAEFWSLCVSSIRIIGVRHGKT